MQSKHNNNAAKPIAPPNQDSTSRDYEQLLRENARLREQYAKERSTTVFYAHIAHALARGYTDLFYVNMEVGEYFEFHTDDERGVLSERRRSSHFFESCEREAKLYVHPEDQAAFVAAMNREFLLETLKQSRVFELTYRRIKDGRTFYVQMKISRMEDDPRFIVIAVADIDELIQKRREEERIREERIVYNRLHAITGNYFVIFVVEPESGRYREFSLPDAYTENFAPVKEGSDFYEKARELARQYVCPSDLDRFFTLFTPENIANGIREQGMFTFSFRVLMEGRPNHVQVRAAMVEEKDGARLIVGVNDVDTQVRQEEEAEKRLILAQSLAKIDALTGVKNKHTYLEAESQLNLQIAQHCAPPFAVVMMDMNDLKTINDTAGHQAGDQSLRRACKIICDTFKHSPVFRIGGDEFAVIARGHDYIHLEELMEKMKEYNAHALRCGDIVIACGMARFDHDASVAEVFHRSDLSMYENKNQLKAGAKAGRDSLPKTTP